MKKIILISLVFVAALARAEVKPNGLFSDHAILQQEMAMPVWGTARDGEKVTVKFQGQEVSTVAKDGRWLVKLKPLKAGGPFILSITGDNAVTFTNVLVGEVWLCSGQSNMGFQLNRAHNAAEAIAAAGDPQLRLFTVPHGAEDSPRGDVEGNWHESTPASASNFSAVAYFFGRDLRRALKVPVGLIDSSVGGTPAEAWTSRGALESDPELRKILEQHTENVKSFDAVKAQAQHEKNLAKHKEAVKQAKAKGTPPPKAPTRLADPARASKRPGCLYNAMIAPLQPFALCGAIWYQGEANSGRAEQYQKLFPALIRDWRSGWKQGDFPFLFVQIAPEERMTPEIREAQLLTSQTVPGTAMAVTTDVGNATDIHPKQKEPVGARLALAARAIAYREKIEYSGPVFDSLKVESNRAILSFTHVGSGLIAKGGELRGFTISGADGNSQPANAIIEKDKIIVSSPSVSKPIAVRYGWQNVPDVNLFNGDGLPASPFRTDRK